MIDTTVPIPLPGNVEAEPRSATAEENEIAMLRARCKTLQAELDSLYKELGRSLMAAKQRSKQA